MESLGSLCIIVIGLALWLVFFAGFVSVMIALSPLGFLVGVLIIAFSISEVKK